MDFFLLTGAISGERLPVLAPLPARYLFFSDEDEEGRMAATSYRPVLPASGARGSLCQRWTTGSMVKVLLDDMAKVLSGVDQRHRGLVDAPAEFTWWGRTSSRPSPPVCTNDAGAI